MTQGGEYFVFVLPGSSPVAGQGSSPPTVSGAAAAPKLMLGQYRHAWMWYADEMRGHTRSQAVRDGGPLAKEGEGRASRGVRQLVYDVLVNVAAPALAKSFAAQPGECLAALLCCVHACVLNA